MSETDPKPELEIKSDADWKQKVKQEAADLDAKRAQEPAQDSDEATQTLEGGSAAAGAASGFAETAGALPPADFTMLITMFSTQAMVSLGVLPNPETGQPEQNLTLARHFIDLLGVLQEKTRRNLTGHESDLLENSLHELRLAYVELSKSASTSPSSDAERTDSAT